MTRVTFGVSASSYAANMSLKQNAIDFAVQYPLASEAVHNSFYVDDCLSGADSIDSAIEMQKQLQELLAKGGFLLRKWNSSEEEVIRRIPSKLIDERSEKLFSDPQEYTKTLGIRWNSKQDCFHLHVSKFSQGKQISKRTLVSDVGKVFDIMGWFSPTIIKSKILLQRVWETRIDWDEPVPQPILDEWLQWRSEMSLISSMAISRCYYPKNVQVKSLQLHGFSDASEQAYGVVVYLRITDSNDQVHVALVCSKTKVAPIKKLTLPRLELCGAELLARLLFHVKKALNLPMQDTYAWTDSTIVLNWLDGNPRRFKTYVGNRVSHIIELVPSPHWHHVSGAENPADCASRGLYPSDLLEHDIWWQGPLWLKMTPDKWPKIESKDCLINESTEVFCHLVVVKPTFPVVDVSKFSSYTQLKCVTAWCLRFVNNCKKNSHKICSPLLCSEMQSAENYWFKIVQFDNFPEDVENLTKGKPLSSSSPLLALHPFLDSSKLLRAGGRKENSDLSYSKRHPIIVHGNHPLVKLLIRSEHVRLLHGGPQLLLSMLSRYLHIVGNRKIIRSLTRECVVCRKQSAKPKPQLHGQLPRERLTPGPTFETTGIDYAGPLYIKYGFVRKPTIVKAYVCVFVSLNVKAVHLELVSNLTTDSFLACLRRFVARRGLPKLLWSDHGSNFIGASKELKELANFLEQQKIQREISEFCSTVNIQWSFIPKRSPNFGGLWEAAVKSFKTHFKRVVSDTKLTFEEACTVLSQIEACLNSRPLAILPFDDDGIEPLTPGHFLIGRPLASLPDPVLSYKSISLLKRWHLCQAIVRHFWKRWQLEYLITLRKFTKWHRPSRNLEVGDVITLHEDGLVPGKWPIGRIIKVHPGNDRIVRVVTVRTSTGTYKRPVTALILPDEY